MVHPVPSFDPDAPVIVVDIGNTNVGLATWQADQLRTPLSIPTGDEPAFDAAFAAHLDALPRRRLVAAIMASVVPIAMERVRGRIAALVGMEPLVVGDTIPPPMEVGVEDRQGIGMDRVCAAAAAHDRLQSACVVVDFGTAVTVDLIDDDGVFRGGAILPGLRLQLRALHDMTARLPLVEPAFPEAGYGRNTAEAMQVGVCRGLAGAVRWIIEGYATTLSRWVQVVATGGDLAFMAPHCDFIDTRVPHLVLRGIGIAYRNHLAAHGA